MRERIRIDPKKQFSKRLARWTAVFWFAFMTWLSIVLFLNTEAGMVAFYFAALATVVMIVMALCYTSNSKREKEIFGFLDGLALELQIGNNRITKKSTKHETEEEPGEPDEPEEYEGGEG
jgi:Flp pilus assembly protein TadB